MKFPRKLQTLADEMGVRPVYNSDGLWTAVVQYTPALAASILEYRNPSNRRLPPSYTRLLGAAMTAHHFPLTGQTILFNLDANLTDGQGRLSAVQWSGEKVKILTVFGVDHDVVFPVIDHGRRRSLRDALFLSDKDRKSLTLLAAVITRLYELFTRGRIDGFTPVSMRVSDAELLEFSLRIDADDIDDVVRAISSNSKTAPVISLSGSCFAALWWVFRQLNAVAAEEFFVGITQAAMPLNEVRWSGARRFVQRMQQHDRMGRISPSVYSAFFIKAWNGFVTNTEVERLNINAASEAAYPRIEGLQYSKDGPVCDPRFVVPDKAA